MSLWKIAWRSIQQRGVASLLTTLSMALGVMLVVAILSIHGIVADSFRNNTRLGYNMIIGATKGGKLQITLNSVFYLSSPVENIPYDYYLEFVSPEVRDRAYEHSLQRVVHETSWEATSLAILGGCGDGPLQAVMAEATAAARAATSEGGDYTPAIQPLINQPVAAWRPGRNTRFGQLTSLAIPLCLGDYLGNFRVVGTTPDFFDKLTYGEDGKAYRFASGRNFQEFSDDHGYFEAVLGATVARELGLKTGDTFSPSHGASEAEGGTSHASDFTIVGVLAPTGTPNDRAAFINLEGFFLMEDHAKPLKEETADGAVAPRQTEAPDPPAARTPLPIEQREVTAVLVRTVSPAVAMGLANVIDEGSTAQVVLPILEIFRLFEVFVNPIQRLLIVLTAMICIVSGVSILVSIYNSMSERKQEIAVMRALGAGRATVMTIILLESIILALGGGLLGFIGGHVLNGLAGPRIEAMTGVSVGFFDLAPGLNVLALFSSDPTMNVELSTELLIIPALVALAIVVGIFPALAAYRTDVARSLSA